MMAFIQLFDIIIFNHSLLQHDATGEKPSCAPFKDDNSEDGNYIMYYAAIEGNRPNNFKFSTCSKSKIGAVLSSAVNTACLIGE